MQTLQTLIVEDNALDAELIVAELRRHGYDLKWQRVETKADFLDALKTPPDIILSDYSMPHFSGLLAVELMQQSGLDVPILLISGTVGEDVAVEAIKRGATDYLLKDRLVRLGSAVKRALKEKELRHERREAEEKNRHQLLELERWRDVTLDRENRIQALKNEVNELLMLAGKPARYESQKAEAIKPA